MAGKTIVLSVFLLAVPVLSGIGLADYTSHMGLGLTVGAPTGINYKASFEGCCGASGLATSFGVGVGWIGSEGASFEFGEPVLYWDLLYQYGLYRNRKGHWLFYTGGGMYYFLDSEDEVQVGFRVPAGCEYVFHEPRIGLFAEAGLPIPLKGLMLAVGGRWYLL